MSYASAKQRAYFNANKKKLARRGVDVAAWNAADKAARKNLERLTHLVEFMRGDYAIAHAARKGWLDVGKLIPRVGSSKRAAQEVVTRSDFIQRLLQTARSNADHPAVKSSRLLLANSIRNSRKVVRR